MPRSQPTIGGTGLTFNRPSAALLTLLVRLVGHVRLAIADIQVTINRASLFASFKANTAAIGLCTVLNDLSAPEPEILALIRGRIRNEIAETYPRFASTFAS